MQEIRHYTFCCTALRLSPPQYITVGPLTATYRKILLPLHAQKKKKGKNTKKENLKTNSIFIRLKIEGRRMENENVNPLHTLIWLWRSVEMSVLSRPAERLEMVEE